MTKPIPIGTLVRPTDAALNSDSYGLNNQRFVSEHGLLHVVIADGDNFQNLKSLATGHEHRFFFRDELETAEEAPTDA